MYHDNSFHINDYNTLIPRLKKTPTTQTSSAPALFTSWIPTLNPALPLLTKKVGYRKGFALYQNRPLFQFKKTLTFLCRENLLFGIGFVLARFVLASWLGLIWD